MRTLKKALCLVLVLSMVMGIGVIGAGAAYSDADQIEYQEAVDVMTAIGVMQGVGENTFDPDGTFTRAQAAKMLSYMILGETAAEALPARSDFSDVSADQWFSKYIGFGVSEGYLAGMGDGTFAPDAPVTGYQWAKMLLCALGYDPKTEGLEGVGYEINVAKLVLTDVKLFEGNEGADYNVAATREEAALYAFNTLKQTMVKYDNKTTIIVGGIEVEIGQGEAKPVTGANASKFNPGTVEFAEKYFSKLSVATNSHDAYGRPANTWTYDNDEIGDYVNKEPVVTITSDVKDLDALNKILKDAGLKEVTDTTSVTASRIKVTGSVKDASTTIVNAYNNTWDGNGNVIELYDTNSDKVVDRVVVITPSYAEVTVATKAATNKEGAYTSYKVDGNTTTYKIYSTTVGDEESNAVVTGTVANKDKVLAYVDLDGIMHISAVDSFTGVLSSKTSGGVLTIDGTTYNMSDVAGASEPNVSKDSQTFYVDSYGYVLEGTAATTSSNTAILVTDKYTTLEDGKLVTKVDGIVATGETITLTVNGTPGVDPEEREIYEYEKQTDGTYTFANVADTKASDDATVVLNETIASNTLYLEDATVTTPIKMYFASDVKFIFWDADDADYTPVIKDGKQVIEDATDMYAVVSEIDGTYYITALYVKDAYSESISSDSIIFVAKDNDGTKTVLVDGVQTPVYSYDAYVNGEKVDDFYATTDSESVGFYKSVVDSKTGAYVLDGKTYSENSGTAAVGNGAITSYTAGVLIAGSNYVVNDSTTIVDLTEVGDGLVAGNNVYVVYNADTLVASLIYIVD